MYTSLVIVEILLKTFQHTRSCSEEKINRRIFNMIKQSDETLTFKDDMSYISNEYRLSLSLSQYIYI